MTHKPADLQKLMEAAMPSNVDWRFRPMFGGIGAYANDRMCASLSDVGLAVKLEGEAHAALLEHNGARPLRYEPSMPPSKTYVVVPDAMLEDRKALGHWLGISAQQAAGRVKKPRKIKASATASRRSKRAG